MQADPTNLFDIRTHARARCYRSGESAGQVLIEFADDRPADNQAGGGRAEEMLYAPLRNDGAGRVQVSASRRKHKQTNNRDRKCTPRRAAPPTARAEPRRAAGLAGDAVAEAGGDRKRAPHADQARRCAIVLGDTVEGRLAADGCVAHSQRRVPWMLLHPSISLSICLSIYLSLCPFYPCYLSMPPIRPPVLSSFTHPRPSQ